MAGSGKRAPHSIIRQPVVTNPPATIPRAQVALAQRQLRPRHTTRNIGVPIIAPGLIYPAAKISLRALDRRRLHISSQHGVPVIFPAPAPAPSQLHLAVRLKRPNQPHPIIGVPLAAPPAPVFMPSQPQIKLAARTQKLRLTQHWLLAPTVVNPAVTFPAVQRYLASRPRRLPGAIAFRGAPIVTAFVPPPPPMVSAGTDWASAIATGG